MKIKDFITVKTFLIAFIVLSVLLVVAVLMIVLVTGKNFTISKANWFELRDSATQEIDSLKKQLSECQQAIENRSRELKDLEKTSIPLKELPKHFRDKSPNDVISDIRDLTAREDGQAKDVIFCIFVVQRELESSSGGVIVLRKNISQSLLKCIQRLLVQTGDLNPDEDEARDIQTTRTAIEKFQARLGLKVDGRIGTKETWPAILKTLQAGT